MSQTLPNRAVIQIQLRLAHNLSTFIEYPGLPYVSLASGALQWQIQLFNWTFWNDNTILQIGSYLETSAGVFQIGSPVYYANGNFEALRLNGPRSDLLIHMPDYAYICQ
jgi:hypothetical protein